VAWNGTALNSLLEDMDNLLSLDSHFSLADWRAATRAKASSANESRLFDMNARNQVTLWGPDGEIVDYARKEWSGLVKAFYGPRLALFTKEVLQALTDRKHFNQQKFNAKVFQEVESPFANNRDVDELLFAKDTASDWIDTVEHLYKLYFDLCQQLS
jgi:alpha-N-acetylglucosaminidase